MSTHTPGPWTIKREEQKRFCSATGERLPDRKNLWIVNEQGDYSALISGLSRDEEADARLISAAPEMLQLLKDMTKDCSEPESYDCTKIRAIELVAKIEGFDNDQAERAGA